jgi:hypothetical protein
MKSLVNYLLSESKKSESKKETNKGNWFRILISDTDLIKSIKSIARKEKVYFEDIDNGIKIEIKPGQEESLESFIELLTDHLNMISNDDNKDNNKDVETLQNIIDKMQEFLDDFEDTDDDDEE